jgi:hypothetical protein
MWPAKSARILSIDRSVSKRSCRFYWQFACEREVSSYAVDPAEEYVS